MKQIHNPKGDIFHAIKKSDNGFCGFGEAYFSKINTGIIKGWKKHSRMTLNLLVPLGEIEFVVYNEEQNDFFQVCISPNNYYRLTIMPGLWLAFRGLGEVNMLLNLASIEHEASESINKDINEIEYVW
jgi:dTDP-4-dehydrorhamnose 3,5-epimerase